MIPKTIHYCWFGRGKLTRKMEKCIASWRRFCPDYEVKEWNEDNFDIEKYPYTKYCYENKKWAFLSDFCRLIIIYDQGGIYFDTDVEVIQSFDKLLKADAFFGFENDEFIATGLGFGAIKGHKTIRLMIDEYLNMAPNDDGAYELLPCPRLNTIALSKFGVTINGTGQRLGGVVILPREYMNPYDDATGVLKKTKRTVSIHWYSKSWISKRSVIRSKLTKPFHRLFGVDCFKRFRI